MPRTSQKNGVCPTTWSTFAISARLSVEVLAYSSAMESKKVKPPTSPITMYLKEASNSSASTPNATNAYDDIAAISRNTNMLKRSPVIDTPIIPAVISM